MPLVMKFAPIKHEKLSCKTTIEGIEFRRKDLSSTFWVGEYSKEGADDVMVLQMETDLEVECGMPSLSQRGSMSLFIIRLKKFFNDNT